MMKYIIIDDEHLAHKVIESYAKLLPHLELVHNCYDAIEALEYLREHHVDFMFLDINMPKLSGFSFLKTLSHSPAVIVTTAYSEHALEGYELNVSDYLLKPFGFERFLVAINKVTDSFNPTVISTPKVGVIAEENVGDSGKIFIKGDKGHIQIAREDILYVEAAGNYTKVYTTESMILTREKLSTLIQLLGKDRLVQVHKSFAIAPMHINRIDGNQIFISDHIIPVGKVYRLNVNQILE